MAFSLDVEKLMASRKTTKPSTPPRNPPEKGQPGQSSESVKAAHDQAEKDIQDDADLRIPGPNDDLDEGETARLGEDKTDMI